MSDRQARRGKVANSESRIHAICRPRCERSKDLQVLTQQDVRLQLDAIADEVAQSPNVYYELFSRLFSERVQRWIRSVSRSEATVIRSVVERDPDYSANLAVVAATSAKPSLFFNPAWDFDY